MAAPKAPSLAAAPSADLPAPQAPVLPFTIDMGIALPAMTRAVGKTGEENPITAMMKALPLGEDETKLASFFIPAPEPASTITDAAEREKATKENARKITNQVSAAARRLQKKDAALAFAQRTRTEDGKLGVRVFRVAVTEKAAPATTETPGVAAPAPQAPVAPAA